MNEFPKYVVTSTFTEADLTWNNSMIIPGDDAVAGIEALKATPGGTLSVMGSSQLQSSPPTANDARSTSSPPSPRPAC